MKKVQKSEPQLREVKTIGDVETSIISWSRVNYYKTRERVNGRVLTMKQAAAELIDKGLLHEGIE